MAWPESIKPFWISREPVTWPWYNLAASRRRPYCASVKSLSRGASQSAVRRCWLSLCTVWLSHSQISLFSTAILALGKTQSRREPNLGCRGADRPGWCNVLSPPKKKEACRRAVKWAGVLMQIRWSARSVFVNAKVTQYTSSVNGVSLPTD